jgi:hypothetical protein
MINNFTNIHRFYKEKKDETIKHTRGYLIIHKIKIFLPRE